MVASQIGRRRGSTSEVIEKGEAAAVKQAEAAVVEDYNEESEEGA